MQIIFLTLPTGHGNKIAKVNLMLCSISFQLTIGNREQICGITLFVFDTITFLKNIIQWTANKLININVFLFILIGMKCTFCMYKFDSFTTMFYSLWENRIKSSDVTGGSVYLRSSVVLRNKYSSKLFVMLQHTNPSTDLRCYTEHFYFFASLFVCVDAFLVNLGL